MLFLLLPKSISLTVFAPFNVYTENKHQSIFQWIVFLCYGENFLSLSIYNFYVYLVKIINNEVARPLYFQKVFFSLFCMQKKDKNRCPCPFSSLFSFYELLYGRL